MLLRIERYIREKKLIEKGDHVLVGVSGGPDSIALLDVLQRLGPRFSFSLTAVHLNHRFRGEEAEEDARFVASFCAERNIPCIVQAVDVPALVAERGGNPQAVARDERYRFFGEAAKRSGANKIALAHHADDQVETVLMRFLRGTGLRGLAGIPVRRKHGEFEVIRPFLEVDRREIEGYCRERRLPYRIDSSNYATKYLRNRVRLEVIPYLQELNPNLREAILQLAEIAGEEDRFLDALARREMEAVVRSRSDREIVIAKGAFRKLDLALQRRIVKLILSCLSPAQTEPLFLHVKEILRLIGGEKPSASLDLPAECRVEIVYDRVRFARGKKQGAADYAYALRIPGETEIPELGKKVRCRLFAAGERPELTAPFAVFDFDLLPEEPILRRRRPGDRVKPLGMDGSKKVKDIFIDKKIPRTERDFCPVVACGGEIVWIPGIVRSRHALVSAATRRVLAIEVLPLERGSADHRR
ncbi:tRNA lysidine(34) synthetase TilS [Bacillaceae bacterium]